MDRNQAFRGGTGAGFIGVRGVGGGAVRGKEDHYSNRTLATEKPPFAKNPLLGPLEKTCMPAKCLHKEG